MVQLGQWGKSRLHTYLLELPNPASQSQPAHKKRTRSANGEACVHRAMRTAPNPLPPSLYAYASTSKPTHPPATPAALLDQPGRKARQLQLLASVSWGAASKTASRRRRLGCRSKTYRPPTESPSTCLPAGPPTRAAQVGTPDRLPRMACLWLGAAAGMKASPALLATRKPGAAASSAVMPVA